MNSDLKWLAVPVLILLVLCCCATLVFGGLAGAAVYVQTPFIGQSTATRLAFSTSSAWTSTPRLPTATIRVTPAPTLVRVMDKNFLQTLKTLEEAIVPVNDLYELSARFNGKKNISKTLPAPKSVYKVGDMETFWASNQDTDTHFKVNVVLQYITDHSYFWIEEGVKYNASDLSKLADTFEKKIFPTNRKTFGSEWFPGVDNDPHIYMVLAKNLGDRIAGYYGSNDEINPDIHEYSNGHEMFWLNADNIRLADEFTYSVLAHEYQHMIHWYNDRNEETWVNEGFSELAAFMNGYSVGGHDTAYTRAPDIQLNDWPNDKSSTLPHYGSSFLFMAYFLDRFGEQTTQSLIKDARNGFESIDSILSGLNITDALTGKKVLSDDVFVDWTLANYLKDGKVADGRFTYKNYPSSPRVNPTETISKCPQDWLNRTVKQYGVDYLRISCSGNYTLNFEGGQMVKVLPEIAHSGSYGYWSNKGDESDMMLTRSFDFSDTSGSINLTYWTWYDLEKGYDYVYLTVSEDGQSWKILKTPSAKSKDEDTSGNSFGWGYNDKSGKWIQEKVDLSAYTGKKVQVRFEYVTDAAVNGEGFMIDDIAIPEINYATDFEKDDGGWTATGFVRIQNGLPQTYRLSLIKRGKTTTVEYLTLADDQTLNLPLIIGGDVSDVTLVVTGTTRFTRTPASYRFAIK